MADSSPIKYHQATFDLLGLTPTVAHGAVKLLDGIEAVSRCALPQSVREWYSLEGADAIMEQYGAGGYGGDPAVRLNELGTAYDEWYGKPGPANFVALGWLIIMHENQGVCNWAVSLDDSEDPYVAVEVDSSDSANSLADIRWDLFADHFSTFVYTRVFDFGNSHSLMGQLEPLGRDDLAFLKDSFKEEPRTFRWPGTANYRFSDENGRIVVWNNDGTTTKDFQQADWQISARSEDGLFRVAKRIWRCSGIAERLYSVDDRGESVLQRLRRGS